MKQKAAKNTTKAAEFARIPMYDEIRREEVNEGCTRYHIGEGFSLDIVETEKEYDYGSVNVYGLVVKVTYRTISKGEKAGRVFCSLPQVKTKEGEYSPLAILYNKEMREAIDKALAIHYNGGADAE